MRFNLLLFSVEVIISLNDRVLNYAIKILKSHVYSLRQTAVNFIHEIPQLASGRKCEGLAQSQCIEYNQIKVK